MTSTVDDEKVATKRCSNCKRDVAESNFVMHEIHCLKNIVLCQKCKEPVAKVNIAQHIDELHALVNCGLCSQSVERSLLDEHKSVTCSKRPKTCSFCELAVSSDEIEKHESYCGTRTEPCPKCLQYIMHRDQKMHEESNCALPARNEPVVKARDYYADSEDFWDDYSGNLAYAGGDGEPFHGRGHMDSELLDPLLDLQDYLKGANTTQSGAAKRNPDRRRHGADFLHHERGRDFSTAEEERVFDDFVKFALDKKSNVTSSKNESRPEQIEDTQYFPCEYCDDYFPASLLHDHQVFCSTQFEDTEWKPKPEYGKNLLKENHNTSRAKCSAAEAINKDELVLPCEFCDELFPSEQLMTHQHLCDVRRLLHDDDNQDSREQMRRPPSLPSSLDTLSIAPGPSSTLKTSSSIPHRLPQIAGQGRSNAIDRKTALASATGAPGPCRYRNVIKDNSHLSSRSTVTTVKQLTQPEGSSATGGQSYRPVIHQRTAKPATRSTQGKPAVTRLNAKDGTSTVRSTGVPPMAYPSNFSNYGSTRPTASSRSELPLEFEESVAARPNQSTTRSTAQRRVPRRS